MLRILITVSLLMTAFFAGIGVLLFRQWGWSEYASDESYVAYVQFTDNDPQFFIVSIDGKENLRLGGNNDLITALDCSPNGRTLAVLTDTAHMYVLKQAGLDYMLDIPRDYPDYHNLSVANDGKVVLYQSWQADVFVNVNGFRKFLLPQRNISYAYVRVTSDGRTLYYDDKQPYPHIQMASLSALQPAFSIEDNYAGNAEWLASEKLFVYTHIVNVRSYQRMLVDISHQQQVLLTWSDINTNILSPDGTKLVFSFWLGADIYLANSLINHQFLHSYINDDSDYMPLTHNQDVQSYPLCFLTFRPQMLIADKQ